ncbi:hypothetical protein ASG44_10950 [Methylophilus sp. Leaf459]|jgi:hypothetical protein|nr:hypothetical protein ASG34_09420 [Methylophilus sp. Leaf416]KQT55943.1 hypothetical protein ASG44_10950 [Methylophilus sp. Leaf459]
MIVTPQSLARQFCNGTYVNATDASLWRETFTYLASVNDESIFLKEKIQSLWLIYGGDLRAKIKDDTLILQVLRRALPGYNGDGVTLYRGESWFLFDQDKIGFCWTISEEIATTYAKGLNAVESGGVLLKCYAPKEAILAAPESGTSTGHVYICDPGKLLRLTTQGLFPKL